MYKLTVALVLLSLNMLGAKFASADDLCFIGSVSPLTGVPGSAMPASNDNKPILDEADAIRNGFGISSPLFESDILDDFSTKDGNVYIAQPLIAYLVSQNGSDPTENGVGFVVAHEYAHQFQFKIWASGHDTQQLSIVQNELQADFIAAAWFGINQRPGLIALRRQVGPSFDTQTAVDFEEQNLEQLAEQSGTFLSWTPQFHGTEQQRDAAIKAGVQYGDDFYQAGSDTAFKTYSNELYDASKQMVKQILSN